MSSNLQFEQQKNKYKKFPNTINSSIPYQFDLSKV